MSTPFARHIGQGCPDPCGCSGVSTCHCTIQVLGCSGMPLPGVVVSLSGVMGTVTTDASGNAVFNVAAGTYDVSVSGAIRFDDTTFAAQTLACGATTIVRMFPYVSAGYVCAIVGCVYPLKKVLNFTSSAFGSTTITWNPVSGLYEGTIPGYTGAGCLCAASTQDIGITFSPLFGEIRQSWVVFLAGGLNSCPGGFSSYTLSVTLTTLICPPAFLWTGSFTSKPDCNSFDPPTYYWGINVTDNITVVE